MLRPRPLIALAAFAVLAGALPACTESGTRIALDSPAPLKAHFETDRADVVAGRFLLLPVRPDKSKDTMFSSGSRVFSMSAWSGLYFGKGAYASEQWLNLEVVDLQRNTHRTVFDRQVALGGWGHSFRDYQQGKLMFENLLILAARTEDTNDDQQIDSDDTALAYVYDLASTELHRIAPEGYSVEHMEVRDDGIVMVVEEAVAPHTLAVYLYEPRTKQGQFVVTGLKP